jgi:hypothetical protein
MPGRDPEAQSRSEVVADAIRAEMVKQNLTGAALRAKLIESGIQVPNDMWLSRRLNGDVNLIQPVKVVYGPTADLEAIAKVLGADPNRLIRAVNSASKSKASKPDTTPAAA